MSSLSGLNELTVLVDRMAEILKEHLEMVSCAIKRLSDGCSSEEEHLSTAELLSKVEEKHERLVKRAAAAVAFKGAVERRHVQQRSLAKALHMDLKRLPSWEVLIATVEHLESEKDRLDSLQKTPEEEAELTVLDMAGSMRPGSPRRRLAVTLGVEEPCPSWDTLIFRIERLLEEKGKLDLLRGVLQERRSRTKMERGYGPKHNT